MTGVAVAALKAEVRGLNRQYATEVYPAGLQARLVSATTELRLAGQSWSRIGQSLGVASTTLKWQG